MRVHSLVTFLTMGLTVFSACVWAEDSAGEYFMLKCSDGVMRKVRLPGKGAVRFPLFPDDGAREQAAERDAACRLLPRQVTPESELSRELGKYGMRAFSCDFEDETWSCLLYSPRGSFRRLPLIIQKGLLAPAHLPRPTCHVSFGLGPQSGRGLED